MADAKITELDELTSAADEDQLPIVDDPGGTPATKRITVGNLRESLGGSTPVVSAAARVYAHQNFR